MLTLPGLVDAHVHLREPGATHKEDILSGTSAALAGGIVAVFDMPNNKPPIVDEPTFVHKKGLFQRKAVSDYGLFLGFDGVHTAPLVALASQAIGLKLYLDETFGDMTTAEPRALAEVFESWPGPGPIAIHAESPSIRVALNLAHRYRQRLHVCHAPDPADLLAIESARQRGAAVTCEVTPHHLFLTTGDAARLGPYGQMKPPLVSPDAVCLFWERLALVDCIASDHAPHTHQEKASLTPPPGVPGLETTLPLLLYGVHTGRLSLERMIALTHTAPLRIYNVTPPPATAIEVEMGAPYRLPEGGYRTRCGWSPFAGQWALGHVQCVTLRGRIVWRDGQAQVRPGAGVDLVTERANQAE